VTNMTENKRWRVATGLPSYSKQEGVEPLENKASTLVVGANVRLHCRLARP
jgi:hypothetical protein